MSNKYLEKIAEQTEYRGPSNWQTAGIVGAGILGSAALGARAVHVLDKTLKPHGLSKVNLDELRKIQHFQSGAGLHPEVISALEQIDKNVTTAGIPAAVGMASVPAVALHRQYQDYKSGNKDPHYGRGALLGGMAGTLAVQNWHPAIGILGGAAAGLGAVGLNHLHNKWSNHE